MQRVRISVAFAVLLLMLDPRQGLAVPVFSSALVCEQNGNGIPGEVRDTGQASLTSIRVARCAGARFFAYLRRCARLKSHRIGIIDTVLNVVACSPAV